MGSFKPLFTVVLKHEFFSDGVSHGLRFEANAETSVLLRRSDIGLRSVRGGVSVHVDQGAADALLLMAEEGALSFVFKAYGVEDAFSHASEPALLSAGKLVFLDSRKAKKSGDEIRLHRGVTVGERQIMLVDDPEISELLDPPDRIRPPVVLVRIDASSSPKMPFAKRLAAAQERYVARFAARQTYWKYYLLGRLMRPNVDIVEAGDRVAFEPLGAVTLSDGRHQAVAFRSRTPIALQQRSELRFQLRERDGENERVVMRRLPVAGATVANQEMVGGKLVSISEIYVNG